uniref:Orexigenic neuropeptide QRFP n=1 Tax=Pogona vitticeps TaxID=103695 RepID=A0A6J0TUE1_9SAUR
MKVSCPFSCVLLLSFGVCFPPEHGKELSSPGGKSGVTQEQPSPFQASETPKGWRRLQDLCSLFPVAKRPPSLGKEKAALRSHFRRQQGGQDPKSEAINYLPEEEEEGEKRAGSLGSLAEELNGYNRKKGGFSFRFGRRKKTDVCS